ncbi:colon cancer-associated Mic1-like domain-containing protein [Cavenderia fasciculata]|uniref:Colon cancer-associated Mic1-like domain-containing protein n=1 Tax=Cavenderia fasciculata TaxID=261658 RepID=F4Q2R2_CACFS|nr:colon cancer-associated Mic1-like domain-containing protein [Cavenderia fasciculata]EGG17529.1 colon cancer-associated Mic1-like domain-containing protein [Cavenderia fasciculata]|eukprot:XP_004356013.1 colon cancer-associated Mic1-like domain-containing protein [Cavenderia fasciculata]
MSVELISTSLRIERNETFLSLDDYLNIVILSGQNGFGYVSLSTKERVFYWYDLSTTIYTSQFSSDKTIKDAKFSSNGIYTAAQFNDTDIEILNTKDGKRIIQTTKFKSTKGTVILGFYFISTSLLIITNTSLELYQIIANGDNIQCKLVKDTKIKIQSFIYSSKSGILLSYGGDKNNSIQPYKFTSNYIEKLPKFAIESSTLLDINNLYITLLYGKTYCIYGDNTQISFYEINPETVYRTQVIQLILPGKNNIQFVDNLIIVHYNELSVVYDLKMLKEDFPISAIPMVYKPSPSSPSTTTSDGSSPSNGSSPNTSSPRSGATPRITASSSSLLLQQRENAQQQQQQQPSLYARTWRYVHPNYIFDSATGQFFEVRLNYEKIAHFFQVDIADKIIPFLQQRSTQSAKQALLAHIKTMVEFKKDTLESFGKIFDSLNHDLRIMTGKNNTLMLQKHLTAKKMDSNTGATSTMGSRLNHSLGNTTPRTSGQNNDEDEDLMGDVQTRQETNTPAARGSDLNIGSTRRLNQSANNTITTPPPTQQQQPSTGFLQQLNRSPTLTSQSIRSTFTVSEGEEIGGMQKPPMVMASLSRAPTNIIVNSEDLFEHVFNPIYEKIEEELKVNHIHQPHQPQPQQTLILKSPTKSSEIDSRYLISIITEYLRSLNFSHCGISDKIFTLLLSLFINNNMFSQLHQFLQYHVVEDSPNIAYKLLSISETYPPALQLSLDMFKRLQMPNVIIHTLLEKKQVLLAIRFMRSTKTKCDPEPILRIANESSDNNLFFVVYKYFEDNNLIQGVANCEKYTTIYKKKFNETLSLD